MEDCCFREGRTSRIRNITLYWNVDSVGLEHSSHFPKWEYTWLETNIWHFWYWDQIICGLSCVLCYLYCLTGMMDFVIMILFVWFDWFGNKNLKTLEITLIWSGFECSTLQPMPSIDMICWSWTWWLATMWVSWLLLKPTITCHFF